MTGPPDIRPGPPLGSTKDLASLQASELPTLFAALEAFETVFIAVSGGADSTALMHLAAEWQGMSAGPRDLRVLTVDHGLRPEARYEAQAVATAAASLGLPAAVLTWRGAVPETGVQQWARDLRYDQLLGHIRGHIDSRTVSAATPPAGPTALVTAHHREDLAETVLMRLARGAGVDGLAGIRPVTARGDIALMRPLLGIPKARLEATLRARGLTWLEDPSNANSYFERVRLRQSAALLDEIGLAAPALAQTARRMDRARSALDEMTRTVLGASLRDPLMERTGVFRWHWPGVGTPGAMPEEIAIRVLMRILPAIGGTSQPLRLARVERLIADMQLETFAGATLSNCVIALDPSPSLGTDPTPGLIIYREPKRAPLPMVTTRLAAPVVWDNRFRVSSDVPLGDPVHIRPFVRDDLQMFDFDAGTAALPCPVEALMSTPVVVRGTGSPGEAPIWIPALDLHCAQTKPPWLPHLRCRFLTGRLMGTSSGSDRTKT